MSKVYLAGPITGSSYGTATDWRKAVSDTLARHGIEGVSPMRGKEYLSHETDIGNSYERADYLLSGEKQVVTRDRFDATRCDMVIFNFLGADRVSVGSCIEIGWVDAARRPAILVIEETGNPHDHGMVRALCGYRVTNLGDALRIVLAVLK